MIVRVNVVNTSDWRFDGGSHLTVIFRVILTNSEDDYLFRITFTRTIMSNLLMKL